MDGTCTYWPFAFVIGNVAGAVDALALHTNLSTHSQCVFCGILMAHSASTKCDRFQLNFLFRAREHISLRYLSAAMHIAFKSPRVCRIRAGRKARFHRRLRSFFNSLPYFQFTCGSHTRAHISDGRISFLSFWGKHLCSFSSGHCSE